MKIQKRKALIQRVRNNHSINSTYNFNLRLPINRMIQHRILMQRFQSMPTLTHKSHQDPVHPKPVIKEHEGLLATVTIRTYRSPITKGKQANPPPTLHTDKRPGQPPKKITEHRYTILISSREVK
jgi:hypothetical protein